MAHCDVICSRGTGRVSYPTMVAPIYSLTGGVLRYTVMHLELYNPATNQLSVHVVRSDFPNVYGLTALQAQINLCYRFLTLH